MSDSTDRADTSSQADRQPHTSPEATPDSGPGNATHQAAHTRNKPIGRPCELTSAVQETIVGLLRAGNYLETAAAYAGVNKVTVYKWLKRGARSLRKSSKTGEPIPEAELAFVEFSNAVQRARAEAEARALQLIAKAGESQWQAAAWRLERMFPQRWGRSNRVEVSGPNGEPVAVNVKRDRIDKALKNLTDEQLEALAALDRAVDDPDAQDLDEDPDASGGGP